MPRILLIEDDDAFREMLRATLARAKHEVIEARHGAQALALLQSQTVDAVLVDLIMPEKEGFETIQEIHRRWPGLGIIAMSGGGRIPARDLLGIAARLGSVQTLEKPFSNEELFAAIAHVIPPAAPPHPAPARH